MYYAVNLKDYEIWLINSKILRLEEYAYYQVFDMMKQGIQIKNLTTDAYQWEAGTKITMDNLDLVCQFKGIIPRFMVGHTSTMHYICKNNCVPVSLCNNCKPDDFITSTDSVIIAKNKEFGIDVWNNGLLYNGVRCRQRESMKDIIMGLYMDENDVLMHCESYSDSSDYSYRTIYQVYEFSMFTQYEQLVECTRSQFLRSRLLG